MYQLTQHILQGTALATEHIVDEKLENMVAQELEGLDNKVGNLLNKVGELEREMEGWQEDKRKQKQVWLSMEKARRVREDKKARKVREEKKKEKKQDWEKAESREKEKKKLIVV